MSTTKNVSNKSKHNETIRNEPKQSNNDLLEKYIKIYLGSTFNTDELEIRFGTNDKFNKITKIKFDNTIKKLSSLGFKPTVPSGSYHLNINNQYLDERSGKTKISNIRTEVKNLHNIQNYCKTDNFDFEKIPSHITFMQKYLKTHNNERLFPIDYNNFEFRVNYKVERSLFNNHNLVKKMLSNWNEQKKVFRYIKRFTFKNEKFPFQIDFSVVKSSNRKRNYIPEYSINDSNVFNNQENYEIELELIQSECNKYNPTELLKLIRTGIKYVLSGLQETNYPISYDEQKVILSQYLNIINGKKMERRINNGDFVGPSSISLEMKNIIKYDEKNKIPNIHEPYSITDKADGARKLLYVSKNGKIYLININMGVEFTGCFTKHANNFNTIIDGEHVLYDKNGKYINKYLCFDIYFVNKKDVRDMPQLYFPELHSSTKYKPEENRLQTLQSYVDVLDMKFMTKDKGKYFDVSVKTFRHNVGSDIFSQCKILLDGMGNNSMFEYETDGLIFTPINKSVSSNTLGVFEKPRKKTWTHSFKWKPSEFNTIDFLVTTKKNNDDTEFIGNKLQLGNDTTGNQKISQYKTLILRVGYSEKQHGYINPMQDIFDDNIVNKYEYDEYDNDYKPAPFYPTDPVPNYPIYISNIMLKTVGSNKYITTENGKEIFKDNMIVEFRFDKNEEKFWQWKPIRVRYDKTADYHNNLNNFGNNFTTAQSVWRSINNPITEYMLKTGNKIPSPMEDDSVYYNNVKDQKNTTQAMRDFHNKYVKRNLIKSVSKRGNTLIDMTVGRAGDLKKWIDSKLSFVYGIDFSKDNIENRKGGACARYLDARKSFNNIPAAIFLNGDSKLNIFNGEAFTDVKAKKINNAIFGKGEKDMTTLGKGVYKAYGIGKNKFDIVSNQFSIHYFFKNEQTFKGFIHNVAENCKLNGFFIGSCYDGNKMFSLMEDKKMGENIVFKTNEGDVQWEVEKLYDEEEFKNNESSLGYKINIYQESINKPMPEYLVNFNYMTRILENYGFVPAPLSDIEYYGFKNPIGSFEELYEQMHRDIKSRKLNKRYIGQANKMSLNERGVSFLNNYFIYKKIRNPDPKKVTLSLYNERNKVREVVKYKIKIKIN